MISEMSFVSVVPAVPVVPSPEIKEEIQTLLFNRLPYTYEPIERPIYNTTPEDIHLIQMWEAIVAAGRGEFEPWDNRTRDMPWQHTDSLRSRATEFRFSGAAWGSDTWRQIVIGRTPEEYDEMDSKAESAWNDAVLEALAEGFRLSEDFRALSLNDQVYFYRRSMNPHAWDSITSLMSKAEIDAIEDLDHKQQAQMDYEDRMEYICDD